MRPELPLLLLILFASFSSSQQGVDWSDANNLGDSDFTANFVNDPAGGFANAPDRSWGKLESSPHLQSNDQVMNAAFDANPKRAARILETHRSGLIEGGIMDRVSLEAQKDISLLNNHPHLRGEWLGHKGVSVTDTALFLESYRRGINPDGADGIEAITVKGANFPSTDVPLSLMSHIGHDSVELRNSLHVSGGVVREEALPATETDPELRYLLVSGQDATVITRHSVQDYALRIDGGAAAESHDGKLLYRSSEGNPVSMIQDFPYRPVFKGGDILEQSRPLPISLEVQKGCTSCVSVSVVAAAFNQEASAMKNLGESFVQIRMSFTPSTQIASEPQEGQLAQVAQVNANGKEVGAIYEGRTQPAEEVPNPVAQYLREEGEKIVRLPLIPVSIACRLTGTILTFLSPHCPG